MKGDKYRNLQSWLENNSNERITLAFNEIEEILGFDLPKSARTHTEWWANDSTHSQAVWLGAGYKTIDSSNAVSAKRIAFEKSLHAPRKKDKRYIEDSANCIDISVSEMTCTLGKILNDVVFKPWRNGTESDSTGYGLCVSKEHAKLFPKTWRQVIVEVVYKEESETLCFNLNDTFWTTCPDIKNVRMREWFKKAGITWNGKKPEFETVYLGDNRFRIILG